MYLNHYTVFYIDTVGNCWQNPARPDRLGKILQGE